MTFERSVHHLPCRRVMHVQAVLTDHVTLAVRLCRERHRTLRTSEWLLTYIASKQKTNVKLAYIMVYSEV